LAFANLDSRKSRLSENRWVNRLEAQSYPGEFFPERVRNLAENGGAVKQKYWGFFGCLLGNPGEFSVPGKVDLGLGSYAEAGRATIRTTRNLKERAIKRRGYAPPRLPCCKSLREKYLALQIELSFAGEKNFTLGHFAENLPFPLGSLNGAEL